MPFARAHFRVATEPPPPGAVRALRFAGTAVLAAVGLVFAFLLVVRFIVFPQVEAHPAEIAALVAARIGHAVEIDALGTGWDGWNPRLSIRGLRIRDRAGSGGAPLLELPRVDMILSWTSLPLFDFRLRELVVEAPKLGVRRDVHGRIGIAGIAMDPDEPVDDGALTEWLLRQREIVVRDALITWSDELRHAPQLVLDQVQFRLERSFGHHRFGLTGTPPAELAAPLDLRGDIAGLESSSALQTFDGHFYLRLDYADIAAWREWLPLPLQVESGKGALRFWVDLVKGQPTDVVADLELADVDTRLAADLPPLELRHLAGRIGWKQADGRRTLFTRALAFTAADGTTLPPTDFDLVRDDAAAGRNAQGQLSFGRLELAPVTALAVHFPLPGNLRRDLSRFAPRGTLVDGKLAWQGEPDAPTAYAASGQFERLGVNARELFPGTTGVSGSFDVTESKGTLKLASRDMVLDLPRVFAEPVPLDTATGSAHWERAGDSVRVQVTDLAFANAHAAGTLSGTWHSETQGPGSIDLKAQLSRAAIEEVHRYVPLRASAAVRDWVSRALVKGTATDARLVLAGNLAEFPFVQGKRGQLVLTAKGQGATLDFADHWPPITEIDADLRLDGARLTIDARQGRILGAQISRAHAEFADVGDPRPVLKITGEAAGPTSEFLAFVAQTPIVEWVDHITDNARATGNGRLALKFDLPLHQPRETTVAGEFQFIANQLRVGSAPALGELNGKLAFTETGVTGKDITADLLGGPVKLQVTSADDRLKILASGSTNVAALKAEFDTPFGDRVSGVAEWQAVVSARSSTATWTLESPLKGVAVDLPVPLGKTAGETVPLRIERGAPTGARREGALTVDYGNAARLLLRASNAPGTGFDRALLLLGKSVERGGEADRTGLWVRADVEAIDIDEWLAFGRGLQPSARSGQGAPTLPFEGADIQAEALQAVSRKFHEIKVVARRTGDDWRLTLDGREVEGTAVWRAPTPIMPNGRAVARLARLTAPAAGDVGVVKPANPAAPVSPAALNSWPEIDLATDALFAKGRDVGKLEFTARPSGTDWQIESMVLKNDAGSITAEGWWRAALPQQTKLDVTVETSEAGAFLARFGMPDALKGTPTTIQGTLSWAGAPSDFDYASLSGTLKLTSGAGQFLKVDPGVGRLLGVLSLQSLPRRISLDFRDIFSEGFAFDTIAGAATVQAGVMRTDNLRLVGPGANVNISGSVDLSHETQDLRVRILPSLSTSISAGAAALFIANPLIGAAVGAGTLLAQKLLKDPIEQMFSYEYVVTGNWTDPVVQRAAGSTKAASAQTVTQ